MAEKIDPLIRQLHVGVHKGNEKAVLNSLRDLGDLKKADLTSLSQVVGKSVAVSVKKQLGEEIKEVPKGKRKGQMSLEKY